MKFKSIFTIFFLSWYISFLGAQNEDMVWPLGNDGGSTYGQQLRDSVLKRFWPFNFNFNFEPMQVEYKLDRKANSLGTLSSICDKTGELFVYSHGRSIFGHDEKTIINGDTIGYDDYWEALNFTTRNLGIRVFQGILMLPYPNYPDSIFYLSLKQDAVKDVQTGVYWGIITGYKGEAPAKVVSKDNIIDHGFLGNGMMKACRHGNGRDWWIILVSGDNTTYFVYLLDPTGISLKHTLRLGVRQSGFNAGNATFSYDGSKYAIIDGRYITEEAVLSIFDFDRCTGQLSSPHHQNLTIPKFSLGQSVSFSPNGRFLYVNHMDMLYQIDLIKPDFPMLPIAEYDGFQSFPDIYLYTTQFGFWAEGPDGRHYNVSGAGSARHMHIMDYPDEEGAACSFRQHALYIPANPWTIPNFPHYRLGPLDGSPCDTLGMDNHPVAKFRYEADSLDHRDIRFTDLSYFRPETWTWDFGDGSPTITAQHPYHMYDRNGIYNVCLTVSNENSSHTSCRTLNIGIPVSTEETARPKIQLSLFPNPTSDFATLTLGEYIPQKGQVVVYDIAGRQVLSQRLYHGHNTLNLSSCAPGLYIWKALDGMVEIGSGKVVRD